LQAHSFVVPLGFRLIRSPPLGLEERLPIESSFSFEHIIDGTSQLLDQYGQGFPFVLFFLQAGEVFLRRRMVSEKQDGGFRKGLLEMGLADLSACRAQAFPAGGRGALHQTAIGDNILAPGKAVDSMDVVEQHAAEDFADAGHSVQQIQRVGIMRLRGIDDGAFDITKQRIIVGDERQLNVFLFLPPCLVRLPFPGAQHYRLSKFNGGNRWRCFQGGSLRFTMPARQPGRDG
jgi:hypothetical protein